MIFLNCVPTFTNLVPFFADGATNTFFRQIRNLVLDMTRIPPASNSPLGPVGIHWPTAQTTSLQNIVFNMNTANGTLHQGIFVEEGSGGFMTDLVFNGGNKGFNVGNQQFTTRNLTFNNVNTAISQLWDWGWVCVYKPCIARRALTRFFTLTDIQECEDQ